MKLDAIVCSQLCLVLVSLRSYLGELKETEKELDEQAWHTLIKGAGGVGRKSRPASNVPKFFFCSSCMFPTCPASRSLSVQRLPIVASCGLD